MNLCNLLPHDWVTLINLQVKKSRFQKDDGVCCSYQALHNSLLLLFPKPRNVGKESFQLSETHLYTLSDNVTTYTIILCIPYFGDSCFYFSFPFAQHSVSQVSLSFLHGTSGFGSGIVVCQFQQMTKILLAVGLFRHNTKL